MKIIKPSYTIEKLDDGEEILRRIERAGRTCYKSEDRITPTSSREFVKMILERGHHSVIEHEYMQVRFICDRGVTHEMVRHRLVAYSQESTRYCNYSKGKYGGEITVIPMMNELTEAQVERRKKLWSHIEKVYLEEIEEGVKPQQARDNLPTCLKTEIVTTVNLREWRHIFTLRTAQPAHPQMREIMIPLLKEVQQRVPVLFDDITPHEE